MEESRSPPATPYPSRVTDAERSGVQWFPLQKHQGLNTFNQVELVGVVKLEEIKYRPRTMARALLFFFSADGFPFSL